MILGNHAGEDLLFAAAGGVGLVPALVVLVRARLSEVRRRLRKETP